MATMTVTMTTSILPPLAQPLNALARTAPQHAAPSPPNHKPHSHPPSPHPKPYEPKNRNPKKTPNWLPRQRLCISLLLPKPKQLLKVGRPQDRLSRLQGQRSLELRWGGR